MNDPVPPYVKQPGLRFRTLIPALMLLGVVLLIIGAALFSPATAPAPLPACQTSAPGQ